MENFDVNIHLPKEFIKKLYRKSQTLALAIGNSIATAILYGDTVAYVNIPEQTEFLLSKVSEILTREGAIFTYDNCEGRTYIELDFENMNLERFGGGI